MLMNKKKILIVSACFFPENSPRSFRTTELANEFARQGHEVVVCFPAGGADYSSYEMDHHLRIRDLGSLKWKSIELKGGTIQFALRRVIRRLLLNLFEWPDIELLFKVARLLKSESNYDILISVAAPHPIHWGVAKARRRDHEIARVWVADCGDPYMGDRMDTFRKLFYFKYLEKWFCRKADFITIPVKQAITGYYREFHEKIRIVPQGFRFDKSYLTDNVWNDPVRFAYAGNLIPVKRDPKPFLEYLCSIEKDFRFVLFTSKVELILPYKEKLKDKLLIRDYVPRDLLLPELASMDFLVNFDNNTSVHSPSKLIDYALTGRPILNIKADFDPCIVSAFLNRDYSHAYVVENMEQYNIEKVATDFLSLS